MNHRERVRNILHYEPVDRLPVVHFGFWRETLLKWADEGHIPPEMARTWGDGNPTDADVSARLGFDFDWYSVFSPQADLRPGFEYKVLERLPDGSETFQGADGVVYVRQEGAGSIPAHVDYLLKDRKAWEELYLPKLQWHPDRLGKAMVRVNDRLLAFDNGGLDFLRNDTRDYHCGLFCGSLYGWIRNWLTVEGSCYMLVDDERLFDEMIEVNADLCYRCTEEALNRGAKFDFAHFWEDICFKNGPLISPSVFREKVGPHYRRICDLVRSHGIDIVSVDCDGCIDALLPIWLENGVNTMFPIEVGTWNASLAPWRRQYGRALRGVGGMNKTVLARDRTAIDKEIERLRPLVELGGYIPCPDHRLPPDAEWDSVRYYCDRMHAVFG